MERMNPSQVQVGVVALVAKDVYNWLLPLVTINILWFLLSLTVILMPPATVALYDVAYEAKRGRSPEIRLYLRAVRRWLVPGWIWALINTGLALVALFAFSFYGTQPGVAQIALVICIAYSAVIVLAQYYFWPYVMLQIQVSLRTAARNALFTLLGDAPFVLFYGLLSLFLLVTSALLLIPLVILAPVVGAFLSVYSLLDWVERRKLIPPRG
jgi:uncharacterized membrane protein YesL